MGEPTDSITLAGRLDALLRARHPTAGALREALAVVADHLGVASAALWQLTEGGDAVRLVADVGRPVPLERILDAPHVDRDAGLPADHPPVARALQDGLRADGVLLVPAAVGGEQLGLLVVGSARGELPRGRDVRHAAGLIAALLRLTAAEERFAAVTGSSIDALVIADAEGRITSFNARAEVMFGWACHEVLGRPLTVLMPDRFHGPHERALGAVSAGAEPRLLGEVLELTAKRRSGEEFPVELTLGTWTVGVERCYTGSFRDISERVRSSERIARLVYTHPRTELPNEADLRRRLTTSGSGGVLAAVGLGRLDDIVGEVGVAAGIAAIRQAADRLATAVPVATSVHHLEHDVLLVLLPAAAGEDLPELGRACAEALADELVVAGQEVVLDPAVGLGRVVEAQDPSRAIDRALRALAAAREDGPGAVRCFEEVAERRRATLALEAELRRGIAGGELVLHYQPVVTLATGRIRALEALVRWEHPTRGLLPPAAFIDVAERTTLIHELGGWVVEEACRQLAAWDADGLDLRVAVNVSPRQLRRGGVLQRLEAALAQTGASADRLIAEVTETSAVEDLTEGRDVLRSLAELGLGVALDDFGSGRSSLGRLAELPVDALKLDRSLVAGLPDGRAARALVRASLQLGRGLGLRVVAEGIERPEQLRWLREAGCDLAQGFLLARPVPADAVPEAVAAAERICLPPPVSTPVGAPRLHLGRLARQHVRRRHTDC